MAREMQEANTKKLSTELHHSLKGAMLVERTKIRAGYLSTLIQELHHFSILTKELKNENKRASHGRVETKQCRAKPLKKNDKCRVTL